jgi:NDP-sugar pyrophosphorylase family protein
VKGFILAAGLGTRLRPITYTLPKPMAPLCNRPLIGWAVESFLAANVHEIIVNLHHLPEPLQNYLRSEYAGRADFHFSIEAEILGTGGGIRRVHPQLEREEEFFLVNGDTVQFPRWDALRAARREHDALAALTLRHPPADDKFTAVYFDRGRITGFGQGTGEPLMFSGSHIISTRIFDALPDRESSGIVEDAYIPAIARGERLAAVVNDDLWFDVGTPQRYLAASAALLDAMVRGTLAPPEGSRIDGDSLLHETAHGHVTRSTVGARSTIRGEVRDSIIWNDVHIARGAIVERCIVTHGTHVNAGEHRDTILTPR